MEKRYKMEKVIYKLCEYRISQNKDIELEEKLTKELENEIWKYMINELYNQMYIYVLFWIKFWVCLLFIFLIYNLISYWEKKQYQAPYDEKTKRKIQQQLQIGLIKSYMDIKKSLYLLPKKEREEVLEVLNK